MRTVRFMTAALLAAAALATLSSPPARAGTYRIGTGCSYASLGAAMAHAEVNDFDDLVIFKLRTGTEDTGTSGPNDGYASVEVFDPRWDIVIEGGYPDCSTATPTATGFTTLRSSRADHAHLLVDNNALARRSVTLRRLHFIDATGGESLDFWNNVTATLGTGMEVSGNTGGIGLVVSVGTTSAVWPRLTLADGARIHDNTGNGISGVGVVTLAHASVDHNSATNGAGIWLSDAGSQLILDSSTGNNSISDNTASGNGGGINLRDGAELVIEATTGGGVNDISSNVAGLTTDPASGYGGGIYSDRGHIEFHSGPINAGFHNIMNANSANYGGAIAVDGAIGDSVSYTNVLLLNSQFSYNTAYHAGGALYSRNAVDWTIDHGNLPSCSADYPVPCSVFAFNHADNGGVDYDQDSGEPPQPNGGVIYITDVLGGGHSRGIARFYHTLFTHNSDPQGAAAVAAARSFADLEFQRNIFDQNTAYLLDVGTYMIDSHNSEDVNFRYNTVLPTNTTYYVLHTLGGTLDITGSIIETPALFFGVPGPIWLGEGTAEVLHRGCLLSSATLADTNNDRGWVGDARIGVGFAPQGGSPALDHCDFTPPIDFYNRAGAVDTRGVPARYGNYDLGAVEQNDIIFYNDFAIRPDG